MRRRFREIVEIDECKKEKNLPYEEEPPILKAIRKEKEERLACGERVMTAEECQNFWDDFFAKMS